MARCVRWGFLLLVLVAPVSAAWGQGRVLDDFSDTASWAPVTSDGVTLRLSGEDTRPGGRALRLDFDFAKGSGYCIARKQFSLPIPDNYRFTFDLRGDGPANNLEFKLVDPSGDNVWWVNQRRLEFPRGWSRRTLRARQFSFAWGPSGGKPIGEARTIEIAISAAEGGRGTVWISNLRFEPLAPVAPYAATPRVSASTRGGDSDRELALGPGGRLAWTSAPEDPAPSLTVDFTQTREFGGLVIDWDPRDFAADYDVRISGDGGRWETVAAVRGSNGGRDYIATKDAEARFVRVAALRTSGARGVGIRALDVRPLEFAASPNAMLSAIAADAPRGRYPKYLSGEQTYWTLLGVSGDDTNALVNEEGAIEVAREAFSVEPFLFAGSSLITRADATISQSLERGYLPIPGVRWEVPRAGLRLEITAFADGPPDASVVRARYRVTNTVDKEARVSLFLAVRPLQVCPPWHNLNMTGGFAPVRFIGLKGAAVRVNDSRSVAPMTPGSTFGATSFYQGDITEFLANGAVPRTPDATDPAGLASGGFEWPLLLAPGGHADVVVAIPLHAGEPATVPASSSAVAEKEFESRRDAAAALWENELNRVGLRLPALASPLADVLRSNLAYILINRDHAAIRPGTRTYARTWIRDGCLTSAALLSFGYAAEVREFLDWFAPFQYESGKIPCVVDRRGPDPVPENDSHGEYIFAVLNYYKFTGDRAFLERHWVHVAAAVRYIEFLRAQRMTDEYAKGDAVARACYGLVPESISHEGYSAKPMHSYWDDFFTAKGLGDAAAIAQILGRPEAAHYASLRDSFRTTLDASVRAAMALKEIDYIPGCVELGDFDATSTTVALFPCDLLGKIPGPPLRNTFDRYFKFFTDRRDSGVPWDAYTPYETRAIGALVRLGQRERAVELIDYFLAGRRPRAWNHWAEVVWRDASKPAFIGDMPHTWVGSDFINSIRSMFVYERDSDGALVLLAGVPEAWFRAAEGLSVSKWPTPAGAVSFAVEQSDGQTVLNVSGCPRLGVGGIVVRPPSPERLVSVSVDGELRMLDEDAGLILHGTPVTVRFRYRD